MAEETEEVPQAADLDSAEPEEELSKTSLIIPLINSGVLLVSLGFLGYAKLIYKHAVITDAGEVARILAIKAPPPASEGIDFITFGPIVVNILPSPDNTLPTSLASRQNKGKMHYLSTEFALEIQDRAQTPLIVSLKPFILDRLIKVVGNKSIQELGNAQGRYILRSQLMDVANETIASRTQGSGQSSGQASGKEKLVSNLYFKSFLVQ